MVSLYTFVLLLAGVAVLIRTATRLLSKAHALAGRLLAVGTGHQPLLLEDATGATATTRLCSHLLLPLLRLQRCQLISKVMCPC